MTGRISEFTEATPTDDDYLEFIDLAETADTDARNKKTAFGDLRGVNSWKDSVRVATTANGTLATAYENGDSIDGVTLATGDRILIKDQTTGSENGIYIVNASGSPTRAKDFNTSTDAQSGSIIAVQEGTTNADTAWQLTTNAPITLGTTSLVFSKFSGLGQITAGSGLSKTGDTLDVNVDSVGIEISADTLQLKDLGVLTAKINNDAVTFAKIQNITTDKLIGRDTASTGDPEEISVSGGIEFTGSSGIQTSAFTGDVTKSAGGTALTIANDAVTFAKLQNITTDRLLGRDTAGTGDPEEISVGGGIEFTGTSAIQTSAFTGDVTKSAGGTAQTIPNNTVTYAKMQDVSATSRFIGRITAGAGDPEELTGTQATTLLDTFTSSLKGLVPASGGGTTNFLRADGTFTAPTASAVSSWKNSVRVATTTNGTLATAFETGDTVDGVVLITGDRILLKDQTTGSENGIYTVNASGAPTRALDFDNVADLISGSIIAVQEGTINADIIFQCTTNETITVGTTALVFKPLDRRNTFTKTATATLDRNEKKIFLNPSTTAMTITLPPAVDMAGESIQLIYISTTGQPVVIDGNASETINTNLTVKIENYGDILELHCDGSNWFGEHNLNNNDPLRTYYSYDDFVTVGTLTTASMNHGDWRIGGVGTETAVNIDGEIGHVGIGRFGTSATTNDDVNIFNGSSVTTNAFDADENFTFVAMSRISTITSIIARYGVFLDPTSDNMEVNENACFLFEPGVSANWRCRTRSSGGTDQTTTTSIAVTASQWYKLKVVRDGSTIRFYIDDVNVANHSTQVPSNPVTPALAVNTATTAIRTFDVDYVMVIVRNIGR